MPCDSGYLEPNTREKELRRAAGLLVYVLNSLHRPIEPWIIEQANDQYANNGEGGDPVVLLCGVLKNMTRTEQKVIVFDGYSRMARDLANWWEDHQLADRMRVVAEEEKQYKLKLRESARKKLTPEELAALGVSDG